jgi:ribosome-binding factor A
LQLKSRIFAFMETNRQKKIGGVLQKDLVDILQGEIRKNGISNLVISVSKVIVTTDLSIAKVYLSVFPQDKAAEMLAAIKSNAILIKHDLSQRVKLQLRKVPNLSFYIDDSLDYIEKIDNALAKKENPIENRDLLEKRKKT